MKYISLLVLTLVISCSASTEDNENKDKGPVLSKAIEDLSFEEGISNKSIDLSEVFSDPDNDKIEKEIVSNSNTSLMSVSINGNTLLISFTANKTGSSEIVIRGKSNGKSVDDTFKVTVTQNQALVNLNNGKSFLSSKNYASAVLSFKAAIDQGDQRYKEEAYLGFGFSKLKTYSHSDAYNELKTGLSLSTNQYDDDFNILLCLLEYSFKKDYTESIKLGLALLNASSTFTMHFDSGLNEKDIRITIAMSYFEKKDFANSLIHVKVLNPSLTINVNDNDFEFRLAKELNRLAGLNRAKL